MGETLKHTGNVLKERWVQKMPRFFYWIVVIACGIAGTAIAIHNGVPATGGVLPEWWTEVYPYITGGCIGIIFACKFTVAGGYKDINPDNITRGNIVLDKDIDHLEAEKTEM